MNRSMQDDFKQDGLVTQLLRRISNLEAFEREFRVKQFGAGGGGFTQGARVYHSVNQNVASGGGGTTLAFDSEDYDTDGIHDNAVNNSRLTCQTDGKYVCFANIEYQNNSTGFRYIIIQKGGTTNKAIFACTAFSGAETRIAVGCVLPMVVGEYITAIAFQTSGITLTANRVSDYSVIFSMQRIG